MSFYHDSTFIFDYITACLENSLGLDQVIFSTTVATGAVHSSTTAYKDLTQT